MAHHHGAAHFRILGAEVEESHIKPEITSQLKGKLRETAISQKALRGEFCMVQAQFDPLSLPAVLSYMQ